MEKATTENINMEMEDLKSAIKQLKTSIEHHLITADRTFFSSMHGYSPRLIVHLDIKQVLLN